MNAADMKTSDFYFELPEELIAQDPLKERSGSRMLVLDKRTGEIKHEAFKNIVNYLEPGDCLVLNNTKVLPARLLGVKEDTGASAQKTSGRCMGNACKARKKAASRGESQLWGRAFKGGNSGDRRGRQSSGQIFL